MVDDLENNKSQTGIDLEVESWSNMEYALRQENRILFSKMLTEVKQYHAAFEKRPGTVTPTEALLMSLVLQNQMIIDRLVKKLEYLQQQQNKARTMDNYF